MNVASLRLYSAWRVESPTAKARRGVPATYTPRTNSTSTSIASPPKYVSPTAGVLVILTPFTTGVVRVLPATLCAALFEIA